MTTRFFAYRSLVYRSFAVGVLWLMFACPGCKETAPVVDVTSFQADAGSKGCTGPQNNWKAADPGEAAATGVGDERATFYAVWSEAADSVFAVGSKGTVLFSDGQQWKKQTTPTQQTLTSVWGTSASDVWAVGFSGSALHFDGQTWQDVSPPSALLLPPSDGGVPRGDAEVSARPNLWGVWAAGKGITETLFAVGDRGLVLQRKQTQWSRIATGIEENLNGVWGTSASQVFIVGDFGTILVGSTTLTLVDPRPTAKPLQHVWGRSDKDVYAVGLNGTVLHSTGGPWSPVEGAPLQFLRGIWGPNNDPSHVYLVGWDGTLLKMSGGPSFSKGATFENYLCITGRRLEGIWGSLVEGPPPDGGVPPEGPSLVPVIWAVGASGVILTGP